VNFENNYPLCRSSFASESLSLEASGLEREEMQE